jgi:hypothetical protein
MKWFVVSLLVVIAGSTGYLAYSSFAASGKQKDDAMVAHLIHMVNCHDLVPASVPDDKFGDAVQACARRLDASSK